VSENSETVVTVFNPATTAENGDAFRKAADLETECGGITAGFVPKIEAAANPDFPFVQIPTMIIGPVVYTPPEPTPRETLQKLIDAKVAADDEDRAAEEAFRLARTRLDVAIKTARQCNAELGKFLGYQVEPKKSESGTAAVPAAKAHVGRKKSRVPIVPYATTLTGRERVVVALGLRPMHRHHLERVVRPLGCGHASGSMAADDSFAKDAGGRWDLTAKGRAEFAKLSQTPDGQKFVLDCRKNVERVLGKPVPKPAQQVPTTPEKAAEWNGAADMATLALGVQKMVPSRVAQLIRDLANIESNSTLYGPYKSRFTKHADGRYGLTTEGAIRYSELVKTAEGQTFLAKIKDYIAKGK
jgi:hypothetical protein